MEFHAAVKGESKNEAYRLKDRRWPKEALLMALRLFWTCIAVFTANAGQAMEETYNCSLTSATPKRLTPRAALRGRCVIKNIP
jgi:hypothetical protein